MELRTTIDLHNASLDSSFTCGRLVLIDLRRREGGGEKVPIRKDLCVPSRVTHGEIKKRLVNISKMIFFAESVEEAEVFYLRFHSVLKEMPFLEMFLFSGSDESIPSFLLQSLVLPWTVAGIELPSRISDSIFLGDLKCARWCEALVGLGIGFVIDISNKSREAVRHEGFKYYVIEKNDHQDEEVSNEFKGVCEFEKMARDKGKKLLVHCQEGISRSATLVLAILMMNYGMTLKEASLLVSSRRSSGLWWFGLFVSSLNWVVF